MTFHLTLLGNSIGLDLPQSFVAWGLIFLYVIIIYWRLAQWIRNPRQNQNPQPAIFAFLFILVPITALFFVLQVELATTDENLMYGVSAASFALPILIFIPWMLAAGILTPVQTVLLGFVSGSILTVFSTHSLFTPFEFALLALINCEFLRMRYKGMVYRFIRSPFGAGVMTGLVYIIISILDGLLGGANSLLQIFSLSIPWTIINLSVMLLAPVLAGIAGVFVNRSFSSIWVKPGFLMPSPDERMLTRRFLTGIGPFIFFLLILLMVGTWLSAGYSARLLVKQKMAGAAEVASESVPFFTNSGQNLVLQFARAIPAGTNSAKDLQISLSQSLRSVQFFKQLLYVDTGYSVVASAPEGNLILSTEEMAGLQQASQGLLFGKYASFPEVNGNSALVSFIAPVKGPQGGNRGFLVGRSDLSTNPSMQAVISLLNSFTQSGGEGYIIDQNGIVIYHPDPQYIKSVYPGEVADQERFFTFKAADESPLLIYYKPSPDRDWAVVLTMPAGEIQSETWQLAFPLILMILVVSGLVYLVIRTGLNSITHSIKQLNDEAERISKGQLDHIQYVRGDDEIGQLGQTFEQMRVNLSDRIEEMGLLLKVSQGIASNLDIASAVQPILEAAAANGASMARIVLNPDQSADPLNDKVEHFGYGENSKQYGYLDDQILALTRNREGLQINNLMRGRALKLNPEVLNPTAIISVPLRLDTRFLGILWLAYDQPRNFPESEITFLTNLAGDVSTALANIRLYRAAELGRQRLEAILNSTPDPVFVIDANQRILLANPPAQQIFDQREFFIEGKLVENIIHDKHLLDLIRSGVSNTEIRIDKNKVFYAYQSAMVVDGEPVGKVIILRDITHFKEVDSLKTEFVATVSHDLRAPLTLMRGNAAMLQMVGELNEQQKGYVKKIITGIESMSSLVNNLLDLGRIEAGMALQLAPVKASTLIDKVTSNLQLQAGQKNIKIVGQIEENMEPEVYADQALLEQALYNLVENGIKYSQVGGQVTIKVIDQQTKVVFEVRDTGIGIAPLDIPKLFDKFFRTSQRDGFYQRGSSLGLAIVKTIAERHGGKIWVDSQLGKGSAFSLEIPAYVREDGIGMEETGTV